jgi:hypothetical protein
MTTFGITSLPHILENNSEISHRRSGHPIIRDSMEIEDGYEDILITTIIHQYAGTRCSMKSAHILISHLSDHGEDLDL